MRCGSAVGYRIRRLGSQYRLQSAPSANSKFGCDASVKRSIWLTFSLCRGCRVSDHLHRRVHILCPPEKRGVTHACVTDAAYLSGLMYLCDCSSGRRILTCMQPVCPKFLPATVSADLGWRQCNQRSHGRSVKKRRNISSNICVNEG